MDCNVINNEINLCHTALDTYFEEKVDLDITIPDYSPSAEKIIKCDVIPAIISHSFDSEKMYIEGVCTANIMYTDEHTGQIKSISENLNFRREIPLKEKLYNLRAKFKIRTSNVLCRLQNSKRISVKTVVGIAIKVMGNSKYDLICGFENSDIESMYETANIFPYINCGETQINIKGEIHSEFPVGDIIKYSADMLLTEVKVINERAILKGNAVIECLYTTGERIDDFCCSSTVVPFSEIVDIPDAAEDDTCDTEIFVTGVTVEMGNSSSNDIINFEIEGTAISSVFREMNIDLLKDVYSKTNKYTVESHSLAIESLVKKYDFTESVCDTMEVSIDDAIIKCLNAKANVKNVSANGNNLIIEGDVTFFGVSHNRTEYSFFDKTTSFKVTQQLSSDLSQIRCEANVLCESVDFVMPTETTLDCKAMLKFNILVFSKNSYEIINNVMISDEAAGGELDSKIVLYFANCGEKLWDIAKKYSISVDNIKRCNKLSCETLNEDKMLLISYK